MNNTVVDYLLIIIELIILIVLAAKFIIPSWLGLNPKEENSKPASPSRTKNTKAKKTNGQQRPRSQKQPLDNEKQRTDQSLAGSIEKKKDSLEKQLGMNESNGDILPIKTYQNMITNAENGTPNDIATFHMGIDALLEYNASQAAQNADTNILLSKEAEKKECPNCGQEILAEDNFCSKCGQKLKV